MKTHLLGANQSTLCGTWRTARVVAANPTCKSCIRIAAQGPQQRSLLNGTWEVEWSRDVVLGKDALLTDHPEGQ